MMKLFSLLFLGSLTSFFFSVKCYQNCGYSDGGPFRKRTIGRSYGASSENEIPKAEHHKELLLFGIVGGSKSAVGQFPWMVSLQIHTRGKIWQHMCGGSLIAPDWILTASHCDRDMKKHAPRNARFRVVAGCHKWRTEGEFDCQVSEYASSDVIMHESFDEPTLFSNDIALIYLRKPFEFSFQSTAAVSNICIPPRGSVFSGMATVAGWGQIAYNGKIAESLMMLDVNILRPVDCRNYPNYDRDLMICAGFNEGIKDACSGDSGGPLMMSIGPHTYQIGIVSSGTGCAQAGYPGLYTNVAHYKSWIQSKTGLPLN